MNYLRVAKPPRVWTKRDLESYHISIVPQTRQQLFATTELPPLTETAMVKFAKDIYDSDSKPFFISLDMRSGGIWNGVPHLNQFTRYLLRNLGYEGRGTGFVFHPERNLPLWVCNEQRTATPSLCLQDENGIKGIVCGFNRLQAEPRVIASAIAAFAANNVQRAKLSLPWLDSETFPTIIMTNAQPTFYMIPVSTDLIRAIAQGIYPKTETRVLKHVPEGPVKDKTGLHCAANREELLMCLQAFKEFMTRRDDTLRPTFEIVSQQVNENEADTHM